MKKLLTALVFGTLLSSASPQQFFYYEDCDPNKKIEEAIIDILDIANNLRELNFTQTTNLNRWVDMVLGIKFDYNIQVNPIKFDYTSLYLNLSFKYNL